MPSRKFRQLSNVEHVRLRTGMWLGQNSPAIYNQHFFTVNEEEKYSVIHREIEEIPAKLKCLDEACMNAVDEYNRNLQDKTIPRNKKMTTLKVVLSHGNKRIQIIDNGRGIPEKNAEGVFLHLMYGENFDDDATREHVAGQNGVGISLVRIVSKYFLVKTHHGKNTFEKCFTLSDEFNSLLQEQGFSKKKIEDIRLYFDQHGHFSDCPLLTKIQIKNLQTQLKKDNNIAKVNSNKGQHGTEITFELNPNYFSKKKVSFDEEIIEQYLHDIAATNPGLEVIFIHEKEESKEQKNFFFKKGFQDIFKNFSEKNYRIFYQNETEKLNLEVFVVGKQGKNLSWVNANFASLGGSAIEYLENRICDEVRKKPSIVALEKRLKMSCQRGDVRNCFHLYTNLKMLNPRFKSQDKSYIINEINEDIRLAVKMHLDRMIKATDLVENVKKEIEKKAQIKSLEFAEKNLKRISRSLIPKFIPCTTKKKDVQTTLFIAEGDSAVAGIRPVRDPKSHGLFPLRGKPLNVKGMPITKAMENEEIKNIISILNLPIHEKVKDLQQLNFSRVSIITDADYDGYAIRSLIFNFFFEYWPELFSLGFIYMTFAPLYEIELQNEQKKNKKIFCLDDEEYEKAIEENNKKKFTLKNKKRNKGLGETSKEAMHYAINQCFLKVNVEDYQQSLETQNLWFHKQYAENRKQAISDYAKLFFED